MPSYIDPNIPNRTDLIRRQTERVSLILIRQSIQMSGILCDVYREESRSTSDRVYGSWSGSQDRNLKRIGRTRVLGLPTGVYRFSKKDILSGYFEGAPAFSLPEMGLKEDDLLIEAGTRSKWIIVGPEILGGPETQIQKFRVANLMD